MSMRSISSTELNLRDIRSLRYVDLKKVNFFVGHPVCNQNSLFQHFFWDTLYIHPVYTGCPTKKFTFFISTYLRPLISLRSSLVLEMNLLISSFKNTKSQFSSRFILSTELNLRDIRGLRYVDLKKVNFFVGHPVGSFAKLSPSPNSS